METPAATLEALARRLDALEEENRMLGAELERLSSRESASPRAVTRATLAAGASARLALRRSAHGPLRPRVWVLRANLSAYDAACVALGGRLRGPVLTRDARLARSVGHHARIEVA